MWEVHGSTLRELMIKSAFTADQREWVIRLTRLIEDLYEGYRGTGKVMSIELTDAGYIFEIGGTTEAQIRKILPDFLSITKYPKNGVITRKSLGKPKTMLLTVPLKKPAKFNKVLTS